jgi:diguanylate cyclase (GGDEF)-like protein
MRYSLMLVNHLNLDDLPNSAHAHELRYGGSRLRFDAPLEEEYRIEHVRRVRLRGRIWYSLNVVLALLFTLDQMRRGGVWNWLSLAHIALLVPTSAALFWLAWSRQYERYYLPAGRALVPAFSALIAVFVAIAITRGRDEQLASLTVVLFGVFFFSGLMFREALLTSALMLSAFAIAAEAAGLASVPLMKSIAILTVTGGIAATVYRDVERSYRRGFLEASLIRELVTRDGLSGLMNRRAFDGHLLRVWQHALRERRSIAVLIIDVDHFKQYNDELGHQAGDVALRAVAKAIQSFVRRPLDLAARYGGEEFGVILYDLTFPHVQHVAERIREAVQSLEIQPNEAKMDPNEVVIGIGREVTVSVGVGVAAPTVGRTPQGAVQLADEALYEAKRAGRNRVVVKGVEAYMLLDTGSFKAPQKSRARV